MYDLTNIHCIVILMDYTNSFFNFHILTRSLYRFSVEYVWDPSDFTPEEIGDKIEQISSLCIDYQDSTFEMTQMATDNTDSLIKAFEQLNAQSRELFTTILIE